MCFSGFRWGWRDVGVGFWVVYNGLGVRFMEEFWEGFLVVWFGDQWIGEIVRMRGWVEMLTFEGWVLLLLLK